MNTNLPLIAVDVGNHRIKLGRFEALPTVGLPEPVATLQISGEEPQLNRIAQWLADVHGPVSWWIGSVSRPTAGRLIDWLRQRGDCPNFRVSENGTVPLSGTQRGGQDPITLLATGDLPLEVRLPRPDMVGVDRLLDAVAANRLRQPGRPAAVVDMGTAITVDLVAADGAFCGGAIAAGMTTAARALHAFTDLLPLVDVSELNLPPAALGTSTVEAMQSGLFWGALGTIRELIAQLTARLSIPPQVFLTGGAGPAVAGLLGPDARHLPHLTLAGIAITAAAGKRTGEPGA
jgi:type III pantothenate kinase